MEKICEIDYIERIARLYLIQNGILSPINIDTCLILFKDKKSCGWLPKRYKVVYKISNSKGYEVFINPKGIPIGFKRINRKEIQKYIDKKIIHEKNLNHAINLLLKGNIEAIRRYMDFGVLLN